MADWPRICAEKRFPAPSWSVPFRPVPLPSGPSDPPGNHLECECGVCVFLKWVRGCHPWCWPLVLREAWACSVLPERGVGASSGHANEHVGPVERSWPPRGVGSWGLRPVGCSSVSSTARGKAPSPDMRGSSPARLWPAPGAPGQPGPWASVLCRERGLGPASHQCLVSTGSCALGSEFLHR